MNCKRLNPRAERAKITVILTTGDLVGRPRDPGALYCSTCSVVRRGDVIVRMPSRLRRILLVLAANSPHLVTHRELYELVDFPNGGPLELKVYVTQVRDAAAALGIVIETWSGMGHRARLSSIDPKGLLVA